MNYGEIKICDIANGEGVQRVAFCIRMHTPL